MDTAVILWDGKRQKKKKKSEVQKEPDRKPMRQNLKLDFPHQLT